MDFIHSLSLSLGSPMVLAFFLGIAARIARSDLRLPPAVYSGMTIYLLFAIGLKGGARLDGVAWEQFLPVVGCALLLCAAIPRWSFVLLNRLGGFSIEDAGALAAHYGSVSAVTFGTALTFLDSARITHEPFMPALLAFMEGPGVLMALVLVQVARSLALRPAGSPAALGFIAPGASVRFGAVIAELLSGKGMVLLFGGLGIGLIGGKAGFDQVAPLFDAPFKGVLTLFLLEMGLVTGERLSDLRRSGPFLAAFAVVMPLLHGLLGVWLGRQAGLSLGGAAVLGTLAASASYIAAPAAVRLALPEANPALYLTASLAVTFPFNVVFGIPIYVAFARRLYGL